MYLVLILQLSSDGDPTRPRTAYKKHSGSLPTLKAHNHKMANTSPPPLPPPVEPLDLAEAFRISSGGTASSHQVDLKLTPLNLLHRNTSKKYSFTIRPYSAGQKYYAISYTWPNPSWERWGGSDRTETVEITHDKTLTGLTERAETYTTQHFSRFAVEAYATLDVSVPVWIDHECIH
jgi:hypothetical protein